MSAFTPGGVPLAHADHGLAQSHLAALDRALKDWDGAFTIRVVELPVDCPHLWSALYGPAVGDDPVPDSEVRYEKRPGRPGPSRIVDRPERPVSTMIVVAGPGRGSCDRLIYTAYGGIVAAPREWWDSSMTPHEAVESAQFWCVHALADPTAR